MNAKEKRMAKTRSTKQADEEDGKLDKTKLLVAWDLSPHCKGCAGSASLASWAPLRYCMLGKATEGKKSGTRKK